MTVPVITPLPPAPSRADAPSDWTTKADARVAAETQMVPQINESVAFVNQRAIDADESALAAAAIVSNVEADKADVAANAAIAAAAAENLAGLDAAWLGSLDADPATGKGGAPLVAGNAYINTVTGYIRAYNGAEWVQGVSAVAGVASIAGLTGALTIEQLGGVGVRVDPKLQAATEDEMRAGTEAALREMSPAGVRDAVLARAEELAGILPQYLPEAMAPGTTVLSVNKLPEPDWLTHGVPYLAAAYPESARRLGRRGYSVQLGSLSTGINTTYAAPESVAVSGQAGVLSFSAYGSLLHTVFVTESGALSLGTPYQISSLSTGIPWTRMAMTPDGQYLLISYICQQGSLYESGVDLLQRSGSVWIKAASIVSKAALSRQYFGVAISDDGARLWVSSKSYDNTVPAFKEYGHNLSTHEITDLGAPAAQMPPATGRVSFMHYYGGKLFVLWSGADAGVADSAVYDTNAGFGLIAQPHKTGSNQEWRKYAVSSDGSVILFGGLKENVSSYIYQAFDLDSLEEKSRLTHQNNFSSLYLPEDDARVITGHNSGVGFLTAEYSNVTGGVSTYAGSYAGISFPVAVNFRDGQLIAISSDGFIYSYGRPPTFTVTNWGVLTSSGIAVPPAFPHYLFTRSLD